MYKKVIYRDRQELQAKDLNNTQDFIAQSIESLITDAISNRYHYIGFEVTQNSSTEITVAPGRLYANGKVYISEQSLEFNIFQYLPMNTKKVVAVVVWGSETETDVEPRDFLIDVVQGTTEPRAVAMTHINKANVNLIPGVESVDPQPPTLQENVVPVAYIYLTTTGIEKITRVEEYVLPRLYETKADVVELKNWRALTEPRLISIVTDLSSLSKKTDGKADLKAVLELMADMARVKEKLNLPSTYHSYDADYFGNDAKIDKDNTVAKIFNGLLFPNAGEAKANLALFNPYDPNIKRFDNLILPNFDLICKLETKGHSGDVSISKYQWQTYTLKKYTYYQWYWVYGWSWSCYWYWYYRYWYWYWYYYYWWYGWCGYWVAYPVTEYRLEATTHTINGAIVAQTFMISSPMWLAGLGLYFTQKDSNADIHIVICETEGGKPVLQKTLTHVTLKPSDVQKYPAETIINLPPVFLKPGRYAICFITQGDYRVATVSGQNYLQGTLFYGTDGDYFTGDLTKDIMFRLYAAQFKQARTEVQLQPVSLAGGITDLQIIAPAIVPEGTELIYEINVGGKWYPLKETGKLSSAPDIVPLRVVMLGTADLQPALILTEQAITASRPAETFYATSTERVLSASRQNIDVQVLLHKFNPAKHTINCQLIDTLSNTIYNPALVTTEQEDEGALRKTFTFNISAGIQRYKIKLSGSRTSDAEPYAIIERIDIAY
jgi:hypothetical protein